MPAERIVSFLPSATEMVCALGLADRLVGVTHECDFPPEARRKPIVVRNAVDLGRLSLSEVDRVVSDRLATGASLYEVDESLLRRLAPDLLLTQHLCQVCAPSGNEVTRLLAALPTPPEVLWLTPRSLGQIFENILDVGRATDRVRQAEDWVAGARARLDGIAAAARDLRRARVFCLEWVDPVYCSGHWVPEMVEIAGGIDTVSRKGTDSVRVDWDQVRRWNPEVLIVMPCGFGLDSVLGQMPALARRSGWSELEAVKTGRVYAVDANSYFARPGPRVVDGTALLAHLIHPDRFDWTGPADAYRRVSTLR